MTDKELLQTIKALRARIMGLERENRELKEQNKRYKEALERIASEKEVSEGDHDADITEIYNLPN